MKSTIHILHIALIILIIMSFSFIATNSFGQCLKNETAFKEYFTKNIINLNPIEGIWSVSFTVKKYVGEELTGSDDYQNDYLVAIIKDIDKYRCCCIELKNEETIGIIETFKSSAIPGVYIFDKQCKEDNSNYSANAVLTNNTYLEYSYPDNYEDIKSHYIEKRKFLYESTGEYLSDGDINLFIARTKIVNEYKYIKVFPTSNDYKINTKTSGTGFAISTNGIIVTNHHVISNGNSVNVRGINGDFSKTFNAKVLVEDKNNDLAILKIDDISFTNLGVIPYVITSKTPDVGTSVSVLGYPLRATMGDEVKLTNGIISSKSGFQGDITTFQLSAPVQPGNSGGPVFDDKGNIVGIINAKHSGAENASYAIKSSYLLNLIDMMSTPIKLQTISTVTGKPLTEQVKSLRKFTYIIEAN